METINLPSILVIFGATGDLSRRKLIPSLYNLDRQGMLPDQFRVVAFARKEMTKEKYKNYIESFVNENYPHQIEDLSWNRFFEKVTYINGDFNDDSSYMKLAGKLNELDKNLGVCTHKLFYLAVSPNLYEMILKGIEATKLKEICSQQNESRVVIEKPFGKDLNSFKELNALVLSSFKEDQVYRIDHYLGKETVQNLLYFRAANPIFSDDWKNSSISSIYVRAYESLGVGTRAGYYDEYGQLRDMIQSHLLQLLALVLLDLPTTLSMAEISKAKASIISKLVVEDMEKDVVRGQYMEGVVDAVAVKGYREEDGIDPATQTETFVKIKTKFNKKSWEDVDLYLVSGKRMQNKKTEIEVIFKHENVVEGIEGQNKIIFRIQPEEGISLLFQAKKPGEAKLEEVEMKFSYKEGFDTLLPEAYESILLDIIRKDKSNFLTSKELESSWKFVDQILNHWHNSTNLKYYTAGTNELA